MKRIAKYFFAALASVAAVSCVQEMNVVEKPSVELTGDSYVFTATIGAETKTVLDEETMTPMWLGGEDGNEYITVMDKSSVNTYVAENVTEPTRSVEFVMAEDGGTGLTDKEVVAVSPAGEWSFATTDTEAAKTVTATVSYPASQYSTEGSYDPAAPVAVAYNADVTADTDLHFHNVSALLKFQIHGDSDPVRSVKIYALGGEALAGTMNVTMTFEKEQEGEETEGEETEGEEAEEEEEKDFISVVAVEGSSDCVELVEYTGMELEKEVTYYIAVAPAVLKGGIGIQFNNNEVQTLTISKEVVLERSKVYDLGVFSYDDNIDDNWYLIGNFTEGNDNSVGKHVFEAAGDNLLAVKGVTIKEGQEFKIYNPGKGLTLVANAEGTLETGNWVVINEGEGFMTAPAGEYDIYIDNFIEKQTALNDEWEIETKEVEIITGVALVSAGKDAPEFLSPVEGNQFIWEDMDYGYRRIVDFGVTESDAVYFGQNYDDLKMDVQDPDLVGNWVLEGSPSTNMKIKSYATAGEITMEAVVLSPMTGELVSNYYIIQYSNPTKTTVDIMSSGDIERVVTDESGEPVLDFYGDMVWYQTFGVCAWGEDWSTIPVTVTLADSPQSILMGVPDESLRSIGSTFESDYSDIEVRTYLDFDLESNTLTIAKNYDQFEFGYDYETWTPVYSPWPSEDAHTGLWYDKVEYTITDCEFIPTNANSGQIRVYAEDANGNPKYILMDYADYFYGTGMYISSPLEPVDAMYESIPVLDADGKQITVDGEPCYWEGLGIQSPWGSHVDFKTYNVDGFDFSTMEFVEEYPEAPELGQWLFRWNDMGGIPTCLDLGVTYPGKSCLAYDLVASMGGEETALESGLPENMFGLYMVYAGYTWDYNVVPDPNVPGSGKIELIQIDMYTEEEVVFEATYSDYKGGMMRFSFDMFYLDNVGMVLGKNLSLYNEYGVAN